MKLSLLRRLLLAGLLLVVLGLGLGGWLLGSRFGQRRLEQWVRQQLTHNSELALAPFTVEFSPWRDFPHVTASLRHLSLTDTSFRQAVPVLRVGRADMRLELAALLHGRVRVTRLTVHDVDFQEQVDSLGRSWGLHGKRKKGTAPAPKLTLDLDSLLVYNFRISSHNAYAHSAFGASVGRARLTVTLHDGALRAAGTLDGHLDYLRNTGGTLFEHEPVRAWVNYRFEFGEHQGTLWNTRATLNGDTIRIRGTHRTMPNEPGTLLNLKFSGQQPLVDVLRAASPASLRPYLAGATSPSKARIQYTIMGLSGPIVSPHNVLRFSLRQARLLWPDSTRRINHWDLLGTYDNGPQHNTQTTSLTLRRCRIYSSAGRLDVALLLRDFTRPFVSGRLQGRTELPELAAVVSPGLWRARHGTAELDVRLHGLLPPDMNRRTPAPAQKSLSVRGTVTLRDASFIVLDRGADLSALNVHIGLQDSIWRLSNASGVLDKMRFRASATTVGLLDYLTGQAATTQITGNFAVDELRVARLRELLRPVPRVGVAGRPGSAHRRSKAATRQLTADLGSSLIPAGIHLNVGLRCGRLLLPADTLTALAVTVRHDGRRVQLNHLAGRVWGGQVRGNVSWPTDTANQVAPIDFQVSVHFDTINYQNFIALLARPPQRSAKAPTSPALRELLLAANGQARADVTMVQLPDGNQLRGLQLLVHKTGAAIRVPDLRFQTTQGASGRVAGSARVAHNRLAAADASLDLTYTMLDVQQLLQLLAALNPTDETPTATEVAQRASRRAKRAENSRKHGSLISNGVLTAVVRVQADQVRYAAVRGSDFHLVSYLRDGEARLDQCSLNTFQGRISLRGSMVTDAGREHHPLHVQAVLDRIQLSELFATATAMNLKVLSGDNIRGTMHCAADLRTDLDATFLPVFAQTTGYLKTNIQALELLNVEALEEALKFMKQERTSHLYFEPVNSEFLLNGTELLIPDLNLNSNLSNLQVSGTYALDGRANLYVGLNPLQALFGNNDKRVERIQSHEPVGRPKGKLTYLSLRRSGPGSKYKVSLFKKAEQRRHQALLREQFQHLLLGQQLDTTLHLVR